MDDESRRWNRDSEASLHLRRRGWACIFQVLLPNIRKAVPSVTVIYYAVLQFALSHPNKKFCGETLLLAIFFRSGYPTASLQLDCSKKPAKHVYTRQDGMFSTPIAIAIDQSKLTEPQVFILGVNFPERNLVKASPHHHTQHQLTLILTRNAVQKSLEAFFGIGHNTSSRLLSRFYINPTCKVGELANKQVLDITAALSDMKIENDLRRQNLDDIKRLKETGAYRGRRHALGLPVRGQRTRTQVCFFAFVGELG